jgi:hypothetical protein
MYLDLELDANSMAARCLGCNFDLERTFNQRIIGSRNVNAGGVDGGVR